MVSRAYIELLGIALVKARFGETKIFIHFNFLNSLKSKGNHLDFSLFRNDQLKKRKSTGCESII